MVHAFIFFIAFLLSLNHNAYTGEVLDRLPIQSDKDSQYIFYSHGRIVEGVDTRPIHPRWGVYDFPAVTAALITKSIALTNCCPGGGSN